MADKSMWERIETLSKRRIHYGLSGSGVYRNSQTKRDRSEGCSDRVECPLSTAMQSRCHRILLGLNEMVLVIVSETLNLSPRVVAIDQWKT